MCQMIIPLGKEQNSQNIMDQCKIGFLELLF